MAYTDTGLGNETVVFIHGLGSRKEAWKPQAELRFKYRLIIPDLRGHGETKMDEDINMFNFAKDILDLLDSLNIESAIFCGLSLGGIIAQEIYKQAPERVKGLILANTASYIPLILASGSIMYAYENYRDKDFIDKIVNRGLHDKLYEEEAKKAFLIRDSYMESATAAVGCNYFSLLTSVDKPVLLISGEYDKVTPSINQLWMYAMLRTAKRVIIKDTGHLSNIESAYDFNKLVDDFIEEVVG